MQVIFIKDLKNQGKKGDIKEVKDGYAKNYLIKNGYAVQKTETSMNILNKQNDDYIINGIISGKTYLKVTNENDSSYQIEINVANDVKLISKKYNLNKKYDVLI